ncbi:MAG: four helix bundle protein [Planctomycetaceae bacterium]|nr:four helix bundle protein [Planctomycetaceae bacterium]
MSGYQDLKVWQKAVDLTVEVYRLVKRLPKEEMFALSSQMRRAAVSIPSNIAEGRDRNSSKEFINFLHIARGSKSELETQLLISVKVRYLTETDIQTAMQLSKEVGSMLSALITRLTQ